MKPEIAIEARNIKKSFKVFQDRGLSIKEMFLHRNRRRFERRTVLEDLSFVINKGETVGLIGHNGCGKSTTLKLISGIMSPDEGSLSVWGRVSSLIELGAGFHPDMSGRENIYINAAILGLTRNEIDSRLQEIISFSELEEYIDNPVRTYSSGMYMRLAFSVAINVDADILLIDEILAVGDVSFQAKCFKKLTDIRRNGTTVMIVSHSLGQIESICDRSIWIQDGRVREDGIPEKVHASYLGFAGGEHLPSKKQTEIRSDIVINEVILTDPNGIAIEEISTNDPCLLKISYQVIRPFSDAVFCLSVIRDDGLQCYQTNTSMESIVPTLTNHNKVEVAFPRIDLLGGDYSFTVSISRRLEDGSLQEHTRNGIRFRVESGTGEAGVFHMQHKWLLPDASAME